jgi:hypothetical protein
LHFGVLPGCRGVCNPAMCAACLAALRAGRHPMRQRVNEVYVIEVEVTAHEIMMSMWVKSRMRKYV